VGARAAAGTQGLGAGVLQRAPQVEPLGAWDRSWDSGAAWGLGAQVGPEGPGWLFQQAAGAGCPATPAVPLLTVTLNHVGNPVFRLTAHGPWCRAAPATPAGTTHPVGSSSGRKDSACHNSSQVLAGRIWHPREARTDQAGFRGEGRGAAYRGDGQRGGLNARGRLRELGLVRWRWQRLLVRPATPNRTLQPSRWLDALAQIVVRCPPVGSASAEPITAAAAGQAQQAGAGMGERVLSSGRSGRLRPTDRATGRPAWSTAERFAAAVKAAGGRPRSAPGAQRQPEPARLEAVHAPARPEQLPVADGRSEPANRLSGRAGSPRIPQPFLGRCANTAGPPG